MLTPDEVAKYIAPDLAEHAARYINELPKEGVLLSTFSIEGLYDAPASMHAYYVESLRMNRMIHLAHDGGHKYVYKSAADVNRLAMCREDRVHLFLAEAAPYVRSIKRAIDLQAGEGDLKGAARVTKAARRLSRFTRDRIGRVLSLDGLRRELWLTFSAEVMSRLAGCDRGFNRDASLADTSVNSAESTASSKAAGTLEERICQLVENADLRGITVPELHRALNRRFSTFMVKERVNDLEADGKVRSAVMRLDEESRMARRVFAGSLGLPCVREDGVGSWGAI